MIDRMTSKAQHSSILADHKRAVDRGVIVRGAFGLMARGASFQEIKAAAAAGKAEQIHAEFLRRSKAGGQSNR